MPDWLEFGYKGKYGKSDLFCLRKGWDQADYEEFLSDYEEFVSKGKAGKDICGGKKGDGPYGHVSSSSYGKAGKAISAYGKAGKADKGKGSKPDASTSQGKGGKGSKRTQALGWRPGKGPEARG